MKKILVIHFYEVNDTNLWKDNGGIPFCLSKYYGYNATFAYLDKFIINSNTEYEKFVKLDKIQSGNYRFLDLIYILKYIWEKAPYFNIFNFYFVRTFGIFAALIAKIRNPKIIVYCKLDLAQKPFLELTKKDSLKRKLKNYVLSFFSKTIDIFTVEVKDYVEPLNSLKRFKDRVKYLPNGFFNDFLSSEETNNIEKEKILLTVGRLGTKQKNTELLINAISEIDIDLLKNWKIYLVGPYENNFKTWLDEKFLNNCALKDLFVITGNISNKKILYSIYAKSSVFVLPSRWESWGLVVTEAMKFGCYPIVTDCCDAFKEVISTGKNGFGEIVPSDNIEALKIAIEKPLKGEIDYRNKGKLASNYAQKFLDWKYVVGILDKYFDNINVK